MPVPRLILGRPVTLEAALAAEIRRWREHDPLAPPAVLVGSRSLRRYLRRRLAGLAGGHLNLRLLTPHDIARRLGESALLAAGRRPLPPLGGRFLAQEVAAGASGYLAPAAGGRGFAAALHRLFRELRDAGIKPDDFRDAGHTLPAAREKHQALAALYQDYTRRAAPFYTEDDCFPAADPARFDAPGLLVYGVWRFSAALRSLLERLMERVPVTVYLPGTGTDADAAHQEARRWLQGLGAEPLLLAEADAGAPSTALERLQANLFAPPDAAGPVEPDGTVRLLSAPDPAAEVREAARACLRWAQEGIPFHQMAVAYRHADRYRPLIYEVFQDAGIPLSLHSGRPLAESPPGRRVRALLDLAGSRLRRSDVMEFLTDTVLPPAAHDRYGGIEPAAWDALSREAGVVEGLDQWLDRLRLLAEAKRRERLGEDDEPDERLQGELDEIGRLSAFIRDLANHLAAVPARGPWRAHLDALRGLVRDYVDGADHVLDALDSLAAFEALAPDVPFVRFQDAVRTLLDERRDPQLPEGAPERFGRQGVQVMDVNSLRHLRFRAAAVLGLAERAFPPPPRQDPLLLDRERIALNQAAGWDLPLRALGPDPEPLQFALAVHAAEERLQISYPRSEAGAARPHLPSPFFRAAAAVFRGKTVRAEDIDRLDPAVYTRVPAGSFGAPAPEEALTGAEYDRTLLADPGRRPVGIAALERKGGGFARARAAWAARWQSDRLTPYDGVLLESPLETVARRAGLRRPVSPSRLETYATCPYRFFLQYVLRLEPVEEPELLERIQALERGSLIHAVLERFLTECGEADPPRPERREAHLERLLAVARGECDARERRGLTGFPLLWQFDRLAIMEDLVAWYDAEAAERDAFRPGAFELRFGPAWGPDSGSPASVDQPLSLDLDGATLQFQGRIDRVDWTETRSAFRVIDYKTGRVSEDHRDGQLRGGRALQLPIYLLAASHALGIPWERSEAEYFFIGRRGGFRRVRFSGETLQARWDEFVELLRGLTGSIAAGDFHPVPGARGENCRFCDYCDLCDIRVPRLAERKAADPRAEAFARLAEVT